MFNDKYGLTAAVLAGTKTQTRRLVPSKVFEKYEDMFDYDELVPQGTRDNYFIKFAKENAPYKVGEVVAVAQSYFDIKTSANSYRPPIWKGYKDWHKYLDTLPPCGVGYYNKMFVKADLMQYRIEITDVRVERLQDISDEDCLAEGITTKTEGKFEVGNGYGWDTTIERLKRDTFLTPRAAYATLIDKICKNGTYNRNPWVYAYTFKLVK